MKQILLPIFSLCLMMSYAQEDSLAIEEEIIEEEEKIEIFSTTRIINTHSVESLRKGVLEFRIEHRFGDIAGVDGGAQTLFGLDNSADIRIALEYGITDKIMIGLGRSKGTGSPYKSLIDGFAKYKILSQSKTMPVSLGVMGVSTFTYMKASSDESQVAHFPNWQHRFAYALQVNVARSFFKNRLGLALMPTLTHRNYVADNDQNTMVSLGAAARIKLTGTMAILLEYHHAFAKSGLRTDNYQSLGIAYEWITFGHSFTIHLTNSKGFVETQFIPYTYENWLKGQFRLGFCISRKFEKG